MKSRRILIVEDEPIIGMDIRDSLLSLGYEVPEFVVSGEEAIEKAEELKPDLILMDIILKGKVDGIDAVKEIKKKQNIPVIYLTAHSEEFTFKRASETEPYGYLVKPTGKSDLYTAIETTLRRHELEIKLKASEELYRTLVENINDVVFNIDINGNITYFSPAIERLTGYKVDEIVGKPFSTFIHPDDQPALFDSFEKLLSDKSEPVEFRALDKDGSIYYARTSNRKLIEDGKLVGVTGILSDITERKKAELALQESEKRYRELVENINDVIYSLDENGTLTYISPVVEQLYGYSQTEIIGRPFTDFIYEEDLPAITKGFERSLKGIKKPAEYRGITKYGDIRWFRVSERTIYEGDKPKGTQGVLTDITEQKRAEQRFKFAAEVASDLFYEWDVGSDTLEWFGGIDDALGYERDELPRTIEGWNRFIHPDDQKRLSADVEKHRLSVDPIYEEYRVLEKGGTWRYWSDRGKPILDRDNRPVKWIGVCTDITDIKKAENALRESEIRLREIADNIPGVVFQFLLKKDGTYHFPFISEASYELYGFGPNDIQENASLIFDSVPKDDKDMVIKKIAESAQTLENYDVEHRIVRKNGEIEWHRVASTPHRLPNGDTLWNAVAIVITERKQAEEKLISSLKEKETLLKEIHHRVKNNFQIIISLLNLQKNKIEDEELLRLFIDSENRIRAMALIHERLYRSEDLSMVDSAEYIDALARELYQIYNCDPERVALQIKAEKVLLGIDQAIPFGLIFNELVSNAVKHAFPSDWKGKGKIKITLKQLDDGFIELMVEDNGVGIPDDVDTTNPSSLGLKLIPLLAEVQLKGNLELNRGKGTKFTVKFQTMIPSHL